MQGTETEHKQTKILCVIDHPVLGVVFCALVTQALYCPHAQTTVLHGESVSWY